MPSKGKVRTSRSLCLLRTGRRCCDGCKVWKAESGDTRIGTHRALNNFTTHARLHCYCCPFPNRGLEVGEVNCLSPNQIANSGRTRAPIQVSLHTLPTRTPLPCPQYHLRPSQPHNIRRQNKFCANLKYCKSVNDHKLAENVKLFCQRSVLPKEEDRETLSQAKLKKSNSHPVVRTIQLK